MNSTLKVKTIDATYKEILRNRMLLSHKLQRKEGQWSNKQKFDLIDSVFRNIPLNPTYTIEETTELDYGDVIGRKKVLVNYVIDGVQRLSTIRDYIAGKFKISKNYKNMLPDIIIDGEVVDITNKKFQQLDEWVKDYFLGRELQIYILSDFSDEEVREMFRRQNAGSPLTNAQKNVVLLSDGLRDEIDKIAEHSFWKKCKLSGNDFKKDAIRNLILQCMWGISDWEECPITDFLAKENGGVYRDFVPWVDEDDRYVGIGEELIECINRLDGELGKYKNISCLTKATIPAIIYGMHIVLCKGGNDKYINMLHGFIDHYHEDLWDWYRNELKDGIYQHKKVMFRFDLFGKMSMVAGERIESFIEKEKKEWEKRMEGVEEKIVDGEVIGFKVEESDEDRIIRESVNVADRFVSDEELDSAALERLENM